MTGKGLGKDTGIGNLTLERYICPSTCFKQSVFLGIKTITMEEPEPLSKLNYFGTRAILPHLVKISVFGS